MYHWIFWMETHIHVCCIICKVLIQIYFDFLKTKCMSLGSISPRCYDKFLQTNRKEGKENPECYSFFPTKFTLWGSPLSFTVSWIPTWRPHTQSHNPTLRCSAKRVKYFIWYMYKAYLEMTQFTQSHTEQHIITEYFQDPTFRIWMLLKNKATWCTST